MELRRYWQMIWRYWWVVGILTLIGLAAALQYYVGNKPAFQAVATVNVTQQPASNDIYSGIYANQASDYANDELVKIIGGNVFLSAVSTQLKEGSINFTPDELKGMVQVEPKNRTLTITVNNADQNAALKIAQTVANTLQNSASEYLAPRQVNVKVIDFPNQSNLNGGRNVLLAAVRVIAGLLAGIALAFMMAYLDTALRTKSEAEELLSIPVLGLIPRASKLEGTTATLASNHGEDAIINARLNSMQRPAPVQVPPNSTTYVPEFKPEPDTARLEAGWPANGRTQTLRVTEEPAGIAPLAKPKRPSRARKDPAAPDGKE